MPAERTIMLQVREVLRIPTMTTTRSDGWRPPVPIGDDHGGAEEGAASITMIHRGSAAICSSLAPSLTKIARKITGAHWSGPRFFGLQAKDKDRGGHHG